MLYLFEDFALDSDRRELRRGSTVVPIAPQAFDLLEYLIRNRGRLLSKDNLMASVWDGRIVSESALSTCVNAARSAINDTGETQRLIRTIPRKGMRFVGNVREKQKPEAMTEGAGSEPPLPLPDKPSIAVLPFQNMSGDCEQEHFADGASCWAEKAMWARNYLTPLRISVASHALAGRLAEAKKALARLQELDPTASIANFQERAPLRRREDLERLESGLRRAGMPES